MFVEVKFILAFQGTDVFSSEGQPAEGCCFFVTKSCPTLCDPMDGSPPGSSAHGILHARILEWIAISLSMGPSQPRDQTQVSWIAGRYFTVWIPRESIPYVLASAFQFQKFVFVDVKIQKTIKHNYCLQNFIIYSTIKIIKEKPQIAKIREYYFT